MHIRKIELMKRTKFLMFLLPMQVLTRKQWWSKRVTH